MSSTEFSVFLPKDTATFMIETTDDLDPFLTTALHMLRQSEAMAKHHEHTVQWLEKRQSLWRSKTFRVGLIGITSSGKSTLVNALLGERVLPVAVRPSSNTLVVCEWGDKTSATVYFQGGTRKPRVIPGPSIATDLPQYTDEKLNPCNQEQVEEIRVRSPRFALGRDVALVDTPGLDAHGHEAHEQLTLEVLLPSVDAVIFLTTCKANQDAKLRDYVCTARDKGKPVIVVQNMVDSVVEKIGAKGHVVESREQVLAKHLQRLRTLMDRAGVQAVSIQQCSALWALEGRRAASGLDELIAQVGAQLASLKPRITTGRLTQVHAELSRLVAAEREAGDPARLRRKLEAESQSLKSQASDLSARYAALLERLKQAEATAQQKAAEFELEAQAIDRRAVEAAFALKRAVETWLRSSPAALNTLNKALNAEIEQDCEALNLQLDDLDLSGQLARTGGTLELETSEGSRPVRREQSGFWGWLKRKVDVFDANWGYDEGRTSWTEITDPAAFKRAVAHALRQEAAWVQRYTTPAAQRVRTALAAFQKEIRRRLRAHQDSLASAADTAERQQVAWQLAQLLNIHTPETSAPAQQAPIVTAAPAQEARQQIDVSPVTSTLTQLAALLARRRFLQLRDDRLALPAVREHAGRALIAGFDADSLASFVGRYWFDRLSVDADKPAEFAVVQVRRTHLGEIALSSLPDDEKALSRAVRGFLAQPCVLFLLVDIQQIGATESLLHRSRLPLDGRKHPVILVVQSMRELVEARTVGEALRELKALTERFGLPLQGVLVNDEDSTLTAVAHWLMTEAPTAISMTAEGQLLATLPERGRQMASAIVRAWNHHDTATA